MHLAAGLLQWVHAQPWAHGASCLPPCPADHDIFDGWGSYDADMQTCPVLQVCALPHALAGALPCRVHPPSACSPKVADGRLASMGHSAVLLIAC